MGAKENLSETVFDSISAMMSAYAVEAVRTAWNDHRQRLDLSESSIETLETILDSRTILDSQTMLEGRGAEDIDFQTRLWGGYFGEVLRRRFGGEWDLTEYPGFVASVPALTIRGSRLYPLVKVYRRLTMGDAENLPTFYQMVSNRLRETPTA